MSIELNHTIVCSLADPGHRQANEINTHDGGRGVYFDDPSGHILEIITRSYAEERG